MDEIENAIAKNDSEALKSLWDYIKSFRRKLKHSISKEEADILYKFIDKKVDGNVYILKRGDIEDYFPTGLRTKNLENVISLLQPTNFNEWKETTEFKDLKWVIENIMEKAGQTTPNTVPVQLETPLDQQATI